MNGIAQRLAAASGAYFVAAAVVGSLGDKATVGTLVMLSGIAALLVFLGYLHQTLTADGGGRGTLAMTATVCGVVFVALQGVEFSLVAVDHQDGGPGQLLPDRGAAVFVVSTLFFGLFVLAASGAAVARRLLPAWLGWAGLAAGALTSIAGASGTVSVDSHNPWPYMGALVWTVVVSVLLAVRPVARAVASSRTAADVAGAM